MKWGRGTITYGHIDAYWPTAASLNHKTTGMDLWSVFFLMWTSSKLRNWFGFMDFVSSTRGFLPEKTFRVMNLVFCCLIAVIIRTESWFPGHPRQWLPYYWCFAIMNVNSRGAYLWAISLMDIPCWGSSKHPAKFQRYSMASWGLGQPHQPLMCKSVAFQTPWTSKTPIWLPIAYSFTAPHS